MAGRLARSVVVLVVVLCANASIPSGAMHGQQLAQRKTEQPIKASQRVTVDVDKAPLRDVVKSIAVQAGLKPSFAVTIIPEDARVTLHATNIPVADAFQHVLRGTGLVAEIQATGNVLIFRAEGPIPNTPQGPGTISGRVYDSTSRKGVAGVTITIVGLKLSAVTKDDGTFRLVGVPAGTHTVSAKLLGYQSKTMSVKVGADENTAVTITLSQSSTTLSEVVTTATGSQRRIDISNDVVKIDAQKLIESAPIQSVTDLLVAAQVPGMIATRSSGEPGAPTRIRFGGPGSISQSNDPVVIVDGVWIQSAFSTEDVLRKLPARPGSVGQTLPSRLDAIDPATIETIEIVRGPSAATLYGPDAANGVILITTKRGQAGPARWDFRGFRNWATPGGTQPLRYTAYGHNQMSTAPITCSVNDIIFNGCTQDSLTSFTPSDPFLRNEGAGFTNGYSLAVRGGTNTSGRNAILYSLTASMQDQLGTRRIPGVDRVRYRQIGIALSEQQLKPSEKRDRLLSARFSMTPKTGFDISLNLDGSQTNSRDDDIGMRVSGISGGAFSTFDTLTTLLRPVVVSPRIARASATRGLVSLNSTITPVSWWTSNVTVGLDRGYTRERREGTDRSCFGGTCTDAGITAESATGESSVYSARVQSSFLPNLGWANRFLSIRPGISGDLQRQVRGDGQVSNNTDVNGVTTTLGAPVGANQVDALAGVALSANIRLFDRLSFDPAIRRDFGSRRNVRNNAKTYPRFGTSWLVSDESFFPRQQFLTSLRLRGAMGFAAVQPEYTAIYGRYFEQKMLLNGQTVPIVTLNGIGNPNLEPERSFEIETGFDADILGDRVVLTVTYANKQNRNTLINRTLALSAGVTEVRQENIARVVNRTTSVQLTGRVIDRPGLFLQLTTNFAVLDNVIKALGSGVSPFGNNEQRYVAGYPVGGLWQLQVLAIHDANGNGLIEDGEWIRSDSVAYAGTNLPRFTAGYNAELRVFNHITLSAMLDYKSRYMQNRAIQFNQVRGYWDPTSSLAEQELVLLIGGQGQDRQAISELRLHSASVTMNLPPRFARQLRAQSMQVSLQGSNLGLWTQYRGRDPGVNSTIVGERTTDNGLTIAPPRAFALQFRLGY